jgi:hypothetical protein
MPYNVIYGNAGILMADSSSPNVYSLTATVTVEIEGRPMVFSGGGEDLERDVPPAFLSLTEPLSPEEPQEQA